MIRLFVFRSMPENSFANILKNFCLPPLEAMQCCTPVITSNTTSLPEVVGDVGLPIDRLDEAAICLAMMAAATESKPSPNAESKRIRACQEL